MKVLIAPDSFKGSLTSKEVIEIISTELRKTFTDCVIESYPLADGGEGSLEIILDAIGGKNVRKKVKGPTFREVEACYGILQNDVAVIEMAQASGLTLISNEERNACNTSTFGTGELINDAIQNGIKKFIVGLGGSATNDAGIGMLSALGAKFFDKDKNEIEPIGQNLIRIEDFDLTKFYEKINGCSFKVMCDITNPLTGERGATYTFGPQKGASKEELDALEEGMKHFSQLAANKLEIDKSSQAGSGAAGGMGWCFAEFFNATLQSGINTIIDIYDLEEKIKDVDIVISGEGCADGQSANGKVLSGLAKICKSNNKELIAIVGKVSKGAEQLYELGVSKIYPCVDESEDIENAMKHARENLVNATKKFIVEKEGK